MNDWPPYQPVWFGGTEHGTSRRDCASRYDAIRRHLDYVGFDSEGPLTAIDFGCYGPYFGTRLCEDFSADVTAVDIDPYLVNNYRPPVSGSLRIVPALLGVPQLARLGNFHAGLCLSVLHHLPQWPDYLEQLSRQCRLLFVELSNPDEDLPQARAQDQALDIEREVIERGGKPLCVTPGYQPERSRTLWVLTR